MSQRDSKTPTTIKLAAKEASQRASSADPGPGDPLAAPSVAPQVIDLPEPPTPSQLVVPGSNAEASAMSAQMTAKSVPAPIAAMSGGGGGGVSSRHSVGAAREPTSSRPLSGPTQKFSTVENSQSHKSARTVMTSQLPTSASNGQNSAGLSAGATSGMPASVGASSAAPSEQSASATASPTASAAMRADSGAERDEEEVADGETESPDGSVSPAASASPTGTSAGMSRKSSRKDSQAEPSASASTQPDAQSRSASPSADASAMPSTSASHKGGLMSTSRHGKKGKKVTKFRYHKRVTVRTTGKTSPAAIMDKVNKKDHKAGITPSAIEEMEPEELMRRAGIKGNKKHWRVRLRQTKRVTKGGKTVMQTRVAYRDSEGNKRIKTSATPFCETCGEKLEDCKCDAPSQK